jgi:hypothetical protein
MTSGEPSAVMRASGIAGSVDESPTSLLNDAADGRGVVPTSSIRCADSSQLRPDSLPRHRAGIGVRGLIMAQPC